MVTLSCVGFASAAKCGIKICLLGSFAPFEIEGFYSLSHTKREIKVCLLPLIHLADPFQSMFTTSKHHLTEVFSLEMAPPGIHPSQGFMVHNSEP